MQGINTLVTITFGADAMMEEHLKCKVLTPIKESARLQRMVEEHLKCKVLTPNGSLPVYDFGWKNILNARYPDTVKIISL